MAISAQSIIRRAAETLQDLTAVRWPTAELVRYLNDGQRETVTHRPDAIVATSAVTLVAGTRQTLASTNAKLLDVLRNTSGSKRAVRKVNRELLDAQTPGWHGLTGVTEILHFMFDARDPRVFYVYPPAAAAGASVDVLVSTYPTDISEPADGTTYTSVTGNITLPDIFANALYHYILFRAYSKDAEYTSNAERAAAHYAAFANLLGIEVKATVASGPVTAGNPAA